MDRPRLTVAYKVLLKKSATFWKTIMLKLGVFLLLSVAIFSEVAQSTVYTDESALASIERIDIRSYDYVQDNCLMNIHAMNIHALNDYRLTPVGSICSARY